MDKELILKKAAGDNRELINKPDDLFDMVLQIQHFLIVDILPLQPEDLINNGIGCT